MTWTYTGTPGQDSAAERRDAARLLVGDTNTNDQQVSDEEIAFYLSEASNNTYRAAAIAAQGLAAKYARSVDTAFEGVRSSYSQRATHYKQMALQLEAKAVSAGGLGMPSAGGISISEIERVDNDTDRVKPVFKQGQFSNGPDRYDERIREM